ncbi:rho GTPase-activating protein 7 isoform X1 [Gallus gallus]|uniref:Rho GTPase-activating protein 7 n=2 Tax=Gallus gallus TaxID=9031 RepID=A0A1D5PEQ5_CHICK|nr:rho GTPase-activating protein 7 isoform X1 [Gallus gallus]XP_040526243.1 rho GTPase-activating protein 7 isoform X1 [Gallus gallus]XP_040526244.1 rho GTPase-activating protein 7 isoform X1 [Gallus gallus]XP_040526245.1 rho GTPase-activating protein 7 isoform X1 [Gallus gallus]XP_040555392.1 rho GTPase-activating protein 7 isoform X1 [Gallus gallus]XP_040555393.1 rho GTPase-activating protein 7 isoform X1 [Gallus gallus]XP_040555394.1 rho GTPase-activating protein 7 isoform X1 [Gallus gallu|eukprot:XP_015141036.1 rho GTPase-activating protein 7 isoform X1 [Gallus gallus]
MSLAIRKKSWEEHVTQWMGLALESVEYNTACRHGLVADNLQISMEKDEILSVDRKEKCASFPECCHGGEPTGFPAKQLGNVSKELDENENHEEEHFLEASTETLVHVSDDDDDDYPVLNLNGVNHHITAVGRELKDEEESLNGAGSLRQVVQKTEFNEEAETSGIIGDGDTVPKEKMEGDICGSIDQSLELCNYEALNEVVQVEKENLLNSPNVKEIIMPGKQLLHTAVIAQQRRKSDAFKDSLGKFECNVVQSGISSDSCPSSDRQPCSAVESSECLMQSSPCSHVPAVENGLDESGFTEPQVAPENKCLSNVSSAEDTQCLHLRIDLATQEYSDSQVKLRKKKEITEERDRSRLDSMVLLIMKLDQLDQDIENALSAGSSPSSTPTYKRRHIPDGESGSEIGADVRHSQTSLSPNIHTPDQTSSCSAATSGAKPKAGAMPVISEKEKAEIEAKEACDWLRAAGFPQYAQLYEDLLFPIDIALVKREHDFLDRDAIEALCRRLNTLNKCAVMKLEISPHRKRSEDSDEDEPCAISGKWTFQRDSKRWSRLEEFDVFPPKPDVNTSSSPEAPLLPNAASRESVLTDLSERQEVASILSTSSTSSHQPTLQSEASSTRTNSVVSICSSSNFIANDDSFSSLPLPRELNSFSFNTKANEKNTKSKTKSLLKRMESLKIKSSHHGKNKAPSKLGLIISGPILQEGMDEDKLKQLNCVEISALNGNHISLPMVRKRSVSNSTQTSSSSSQSETSSAVSTPSPVTRTRSLSAYNKRVGMYLEGFDPFNQSTFSDVMEQNFKNRGSFAEDTVFFIPEDHKPGTFPKALSNGNFSPTESNASVNWRTGSFHGHGHLTLQRENSGDSSKELSMGKRRNSASSLSSRLSIYDNVPGSILYSSTSDLADLENEDIFPELDDILYHVKGMQRIVNQWSEKFSDEGDSDSALDSISPCPSSPKQIHLDVDNDRTTPSDLDSTGNSLNETEEPSGMQDRRDSGVGASLTRSSRHRLRWHSFQSSHRPSLSSASLQINCQSVAQMNLLQKYSLLKLTALLEKYTPSNKHGFSWAVPKFMKRIKVPDYRDRNVFGVPLQVNVQRTGQPLPQSIQQAMRYLRNHCLDQVGLFRKSGVKSRIQALRQMNESSTDSVNYEGQSAYDVADMLKQFFRDLPEPLMTNKLSETFLQIYQYVPKDQRLQAIKAAIMLLPDENREVLQILLYFLSDVTAAVKENQMTPTNLAVCLAPSLFHLNTLKRENSSPRVMQRKPSLGKPDQKDLNENLAATQGLAHMIAECKKLFQIPEEMSQGRNSYTEQDLRPLSLEELRGSSSTMEPSDYHCYLQDCMDDLLKEMKEKFKGWVSCSTSEQADLAYKKACEGPPLRLWKTTIEIAAAPEEVLNRLLKEQHLWDEDLIDSKVIEPLDSQTDIYQYVQNSMAPHPARDFVILRTWRTNFPKGACVLLATSVDHDRAPVAGVRVNVLLSRYLIEPCGSGKSKLTYMCRIDLRGHMPDWYTKCFGHLCASEVVKIRDSFTHQSLESREIKSR